MATQKGRIAGVSPSVPGTVADITLRRRGPPLPQGAHAYMDSGYQGHQDDHPDTEIPYKRSKKKPLTDEEKACNHALSRLARAGRARHRAHERFRILSDRWRYPRTAQLSRSSPASPTSWPASKPPRAQTPCASRCNDTRNGLSQRV
ncbi:MAG: hypothetical protein JKP92_05025, partial [Alphaproteobacteria bacterium]|nr:hypothetical protein [Alphaproteobacteria bacterium]